MQMLLSAVTMEETYRGENAVSFDYSGGNI